MDQIFGFIVVVILSTLWRTCWLRYPNHWLGTLDHSCLQWASMGWSKWAIRVGGRRVEWYHALFWWSSSVLLWNFGRIVQFDYFGFARVISHMRSCEERIILVPALLAPLAGIFTILVVHSFLADMPDGMNAERITSEEHRHERRVADIWALVGTVPVIFAALALKAEIHILTILTQSGLGVKHPELERAAYDSTLILSQGLQYILVMSFLLLCRHLLEKEDQSRDEGNKILGQTLKIGVPFTSRFDKVVPIGNLEILGLLAYVACGMLTAAIDFSGVVVSQFIDNLATKVSVSKDIAYLTSQFHTVNNVFACIVFITFPIMSQREAITKCFPDASDKFAATRWLLMTPLQLVALKHFLVDDHARLLHASLLSFECAFVVWLNQGHWREWKSTKYCEYEAPLLR